MKLGRGTYLPTVLAIVLAGSSVAIAADTETHPKPQHPKPEHAKPDHAKPQHPKPEHAKAEHPKPQKAVAHKGPKVAHHSTKKSKSKKRGQMAIDNERAQQIQEALVREHYLNGTPSGKWDASSQEAMRRYQADQGWQTKEVPDSRALIRLGLGPDHGHLLNPETAMTTEPPLPRPSGRAARVSDGGPSAAESVATPAVQAAPVAVSTDGTH